MAEPRTFTEEQHVAILTDAVARETAQLQTVKDELEARAEVLETEKAEAVSALTEAENKNDVLESEKAAETARADAAEQALADYKSDQERAEAVKLARTERADAVRAADPSLADVEDYFTEERVNRWAEMADEQFASLVADLTEAAAKRKPAAKSEDDEKTAPWLKEKSRETAAFKGGDAPTDAGKGSTLGSFFTATGKLPAASSN